MLGNDVKVSVCFWLCFGVHLVLVDARHIRQTSIDEVEYVSSGGNGAANIVSNDKPDSLVSISDPVKEDMKRDAHAVENVERCILENCDNKNALKIGGDEEKDSSMEVAESHIFRPLFRNRVRKSWNSRGWDRFRIYMKMQFRINLKLNIVRRVYRQCCLWFELI